MRLPRFESLEPRCLLASFVVNSAGDQPLGPNPHHDDTGQVHDANGNPTGRITLRSAIQQIDHDGGGSVSFSGGMTITIGSALDPITASGVAINGGKLGNVIISGGAGYDGLVIQGGGATVENLVINGFNGSTGASGNGNSGLVLASSNNTVANDNIGTNASGTSAVPNANGIYITGGGNKVWGCVISGNNYFGIWVRGAANNEIYANKIGTDPKGTTAVANGVDGIYMSDTSTNNTIGGTSASQRNIISGNGDSGIVITCNGPVYNVVSGNYIGVDVTGRAALANGQFGVEIRDGSIGNVIGGTTPGARNIISGNGSYGVGIGQSGTSANIVEGNYIGTDLTGTQAIPNGGSSGFGVGVLLGEGTTGNIIGGSSSGARNIISGNAAWGVGIGDPGTTNNAIQGNYIGTDVSGNNALPNGAPGSGTGIGVVIANGATRNVVGGTSSSSRNIISGNAVYGVQVRDRGTSGNVVEGNYIGTDTSGATALPNGASGTGAGVQISGGATSNTIGGASSGARNIISGNANNGVEVDDSGTSRNQVQGNYIGVDANLHALANNRSGVFINSANANTIGGPASDAANVISANAVEGVLLAGNGATENVVEGNFIGTDPSDDELPNGDAGVYINAVPNNVIGGPDGAGEAGQNIIRYNTNAGVDIDGSAATGNRVAGNDIASNGADGVLIHDAQDNVIGDAGAGNPSNIIAANDGEGIHINGQDATGNTIQNNAIGAWAATGQAGNTLSGILIEYGSDNVIGGDTAAADNTIAGNAQNGVTIIGDTATGNSIIGNSIGPNARLGIDLGNDGITPMSTPQPTTGPNHLQNYPVLYSVTTDAFSGDVFVEGFLSGVPGTTYQIQFYANSTLNPLQLSEGHEYLGAETVTAGADGQADIAAPLGVPADGAQYITATATDPNGNTSEFSPCRDILRGSVHFQILSSGWEIEATFQPTVYVTSLAQAAQICGVNHFNWEQLITQAPWQYFTYQNSPAVTWQQQPIAGTNDWFWPAVPAGVNPAPIAAPIVDPIDTPPEHYGMHSAAAAAADPIHFPGGDLAVADAGPGLDTFPFYYNEDNGVPTNPGDISNPAITNGTRMTFYDAPRVPQPFYAGAGADNYISFETSLAGVMGDIDHTAVIWQGIQAVGGSTTQFTWNSNAAYVVAPPYPTVGGVISPAYIAVWSSSGLPPVASGGVSHAGFANTAPSTIPVSLSLSQIVGPEPGRIGQNLTYTFTVTNTGATTDRAVVLGDKLPAGAVLVSVKSSQGTSSQAKGTVTVNLGNLPSRAKAVVTLIVAPITSGKFINAAQVADPNGDGGAPPAVLTHSTVVLAGPPPFHFAQPAYSVVATHKSVKITVDRTGNLSRAASVAVAPAGGTAVAGLDYRFSTTVVSFRAKQSSATVTVAVLNDKRHHGNSTLKLTLFNPTTRAVYGMTTLTIEAKNGPKVRALRLGSASAFWFAVGKPARRVT
jgi:uncharacterized repeat protein (TIGR01451 family)